MQYLGRAFILFAVLLTLTGRSNPEEVFAQGVNSGSWSIPFNLSETAASSESPTIVADPYGSLHVFWSEDVFGPAHVELSPPKAGNTIMYRRFSNDNWSEPIDVVFAGENNRADSPEALVDEAGTLHLTWIETRSLKYSFAPAWESTVVKAWSAPAVLVEGWVIEHRLVRVGDQILAIISVIDGQLPGLYAVNISSAESSSPVLIWPGLSGYAPQYSATAVDGRGRIHVVWDVIRYPDPAAVEVRYARSEDAGLTWSESRIVARTTSEVDQVNDPAPWVAAHGEDEIHIQWAQGIHTYRWHQFSTDGGSTWTFPAQIWEDFISQTRSFAVGTDSDGNLYWADVLRFPNGGYLMRWTNQGWSFPDLFYEIQRDESQTPINRIHIHGIRMAFRFGNEMHLVFKDQDRAEIWTMNRIIPAKRVEPQPIPTPLLSPTAAPVNESVVMSGSVVDYRPTQSPIADTWNDNGLAEKPGVILLYGLLPVVLLIISIAIFRKRA